MSGDALLRPKIVYRTQPSATSLDPALELFIAAKKGQRLSPLTVQNYRYVLDKFIRWLRDRDIEDTDAITPHHMRLFIAELTDQSMTAWSVHDYARPIKTWRRFVLEDGVITANPMERVMMPKLDEPILPALSPDELRKLLKACQDERDNALLYLMLDTSVGRRTTVPCRFPILMSKPSVEGPKEIETCQDHLLHCDLAVLIYGKAGRQSGLGQRGLGATPLH